MERRLAAILMTDVAGYSRLMESDEARTLEALRQQRRDVIEPAVARNNGRQVKLMGDGALFEFLSALDAISCAIDIQTELAARNREIAEDQRIALRMGIHLGDVVLEDGDILGDTVNIAARLESLSQTGGLCISQQVYDQVSHRLDLAFEALGPLQVKNVARSIHAWAWRPASLNVEAKASSLSQAPASRSNDRPSIAVLPFTNLSGDSNQEYLADGITEDIIMALNRCRWMSVVARNSTFVFKGRSVDIRQVADELHVRYVLEGSVRRSGERIRVTAELVDGRDGTHLWAERYDGNLSEIFDVQDEIAGMIVGTIEPELTAIEAAALRSRSTNDLNAWDSYLRGLSHMYRFTFEDLESAETLFDRAIKLDPSFAQAYAQLAYTHIQLAWYGPWEDRPAHISDAIAFAHRALTLDDREPAARISLGRALTLSGAPERGIEELRAAVQINPYFAQAHFALGQALCYQGDTNEAIREIDEAVRLSPRDPHVWTFLHMRALAHYRAGDLEQAEHDERQALRQPNTTFYPALILTAIFGRQNRLEEARGAITLLHRLRPGLTCSLIRRDCYFGDRPHVSERFIEILTGDLRKAGLPE